MTCAFVNPAAGYSTLSRLESVSVRPSTWTCTLRVSGLTNDLRWILVVSQPLVRGRAQPAGLRPVGELNLGHKLGLDPLREARVLGRDRVREGRGVAAQRRQPLTQHPQCLLREAG